MNRRAFDGLGGLQDVGCDETCRYNRIKEKMDSIFKTDYTILIGSSMIQPGNWMLRLRFL